MEWITKIDLGRFYDTRNKVVLEKSLQKIVEWARLQGQVKKITMYGSTKKNRVIEFDMKNGSSYRYQAIVKTFGNRYGKESIYIEKSNLYLKRLNEYPSGEILYEITI
jgi:hypothetical protein